MKSAGSRWTAGTCILRPSNINCLPCWWKQGQGVSTRAHQQQVWGYQYTEDSQSLRVFIGNIRRKIEKNTAKPRYIMTEVGVGYRFADE